MRQTTRPLLCALLLVAILLPISTFGGPFEDGHDAYVRRDYAAALRIWRSFAEQGDPRAQFRLGFMYQIGEAHGIPTNYMEAVKWYRKAAEQGNAEAQRYLARMYEDGKGVTQSYIEAMKWYRKAADQGDPFCQALVGLMYEKGRGISQSDTEAAKWYHKAAEQGYAMAQKWLGESYLEGTGVPKSDAEAAKWFRKAAEQGESGGQYRLGWMYVQGRGVTQNYAEAIKWYRRAAEQEDSWAQYFLAGMYYYERGVPRDYAQAYVWYSLAAASAGSDESLRESAVSGRDLAARSLNREQLLHAQEIAAKWQPKWRSGDLDESKPETKQRPNNEEEKEAPRSAARVIAGTGFFVTGEGHLLTNAHVVENCRALKVRQAGGSVSQASVVDRDSQNDLALLKSASAAPAVARFNARREPRLGQPIVVYGFPLSGFLSSSGNLTTGNIAALAGPADDIRLMQVSAPIQRGNSGGPVLDSSGAVIGVVVSKLDALAVAAKTRDVPQNVNFAIKSNVAARFLESKDIKYATLSDEKDITVEVIGELATQFTVRVECFQ